MIHSESDFALKGGTAINFFVCDMPRLSVDIDLTYLPINEREAALEGISRALSSVFAKLRKVLPDSQVLMKKIGSSDLLAGLVVRRGDATVKIEPNLVMRGSVLPTQVRSLSKKAQDLFETSVDVRILSDPELYGGKLCATLDRQHPRDLFDIKILLDREGLGEQTRKVFLIYLISHPRPIVELLDPNLVDIRASYEKDFSVMAVVKIKFEELIETRERLIHLIMASMTPEEKEFLLSVKQGKPEWDIIGMKGVENLPAIQWKILNIMNMSPAKHKKAIEKLRNHLGI
jgi:hypothetical protein